VNPLSVRRLFLGASLAALFAAAACGSSNNGANGGDGSGNGGPGGPGSSGGPSSSGGPGADGGPGACVPQCAGKTCGDDGCGGSCGACGVYQTCDATTNACVAACDLTPLDGNKTIDLNLGVANVTGKVTWNGGALPAGAASARVRFTDKHTNAITSATLSSAAYAVHLYAGTYAVAIDTTGLSDATLPQQVATVQDDVTVSADETLDLAVTTATLSGTVSIDGAPPPATGGGRGRVYVSNGNGFATSAPVAATGAATYTLPVFAGTYDVTYDSRSLDPSVPDQTVVAKKGLPVAATTTADLPLSTTTVTGTITQNGAPLVAETSRGTVVFSAPDVSTTGVAVAASGNATYTAKLYASTYDVVFDSQSSTNLPNQSIGVATARAFAGAQTASFDLKVIDVTGGVTLNGKTLPDDTTSRGEVELVMPMAGGAVSSALSPTGPGAYTAHVYAGTYDVRFQGGSSQTVLPAQLATIKRGVALTASGPLDLDLATTHVHGTITVDGKPMPDDTVTRGNLVFVEATTGDQFSVSAGTTGAATYDATLFAGTYGVTFATSSSSTTLPIQSTHVLDKALSGDVPLDVPLKTLTVTGAVKVNGGAMPDATSVRGYVVLLDKLTGSRVDVGVGTTGPASYTTRVFDGGYDVLFEGGASQTALPAVDDRVLSGCVPVDTSCSLSDKDLTGSWLATFPGWGTMDLELTETGDTLGGFASATWGSGSVTNGTRSGSSVKMTATSSVDIAMTGDVANGCVMTGTAVASTGYTTDWVAQRLQ
jgi:hypothetical protein